MMTYGDLNNEKKSFLHGLNPLSKLLAISPIAIFLAITTNIWTPLIFISFTILTTLICGRISFLQYMKICFPMFLFILCFILLYPLMVSKQINEGSKLIFSYSFIHIYEGGVLFGLATGLRLLSLLVLSLLFTLTTNSSDFIRSLIQQWKLNYRFGFGVLAVLRFIPILMKQFRLVKMAHQVRGYTSEKRFSKLAERTKRYALPLLSASIRHAERMAYSMDSRAFGAYPTRTYLRKSIMTKRDYFFIIGFWSASLLLIYLLSTFQLLGSLSVFKIYH